MNRSIALIALTFAACGGAAEPHSIDTPNTPPTVEVAGVIPNTAHAYTAGAYGASAQTPFTCAGSDIHDAQNQMVATCTGPVFDTCGVCPLTNGAACLSHVPVCEGTVVLPSGATYSWSSNGCNAIGCSAAVGSNTLLVSVQLPEGKLTIDIGDVGRVKNGTDLSDLYTIAVSANEATSFSSGARNAPTKGHADLTMGPAQPGGEYTLRVSGMLGTDKGTFAPVNVTLNGLITEAK